MEKKDLTREQLIDLLYSNDLLIRQSAFKYCIREILTSPAPAVDLLLLKQNSLSISNEDQARAIKNETLSLQEEQYPIFFKLVYGHPDEASIIADALQGETTVRFEKMCLHRLKHLYGTKDENYVAFKLFLRAVKSSYFEKQLILRLKHFSNQLTNWKQLTIWVCHEENTPETIKMKLILAGLIAQSRNMENFNNLCSFLFEFPDETKDLAVTAINHFSQVGCFNSENILQIEKLWKDKVFGTDDFRNKISKILLPSFAVNSSATMEPVRKLYTENIIARNEFLQALEDLTSIPVTRNSSYALLFMLNRFMDKIPKDDTELCQKYYEFAIQLINAGAVNFNRGEMQYAFLLIRSIEAAYFILNCDAPEIYLNLLCGTAQNTWEQINGILAFAENNPQYLSLTLDKIDFRIAPVDSQTIYWLLNSYGKDKNPMIKIHYLTALETIAQRTDLDNNAQFALDQDVVPQLQLNKAQFKTFPNLKKAYERCQARENLLDLLK